MFYKITNTCKWVKKVTNSNTVVVLNTILFTGSISFTTTFGMNQRRSECEGREREIVANDAGDLTRTKRSRENSDTTLGDIDILLLLILVMKRSI